QTELVRLQAIAANAPQLRAQQTRFATALPSQPGISDFIRKVQDAANAAHLDFLSIAPSVPSAPTAAGPASAPAAPAPAAPAPATSPTPSPAPGAAGAPAAPTGPATIPGISTITVTITAKGTFFPMKDFIHRLEHLPRALRVNNFTISSAG